MENPVNGKEGMENPGSPGIVLLFGVQGSRFQRLQSRERLSGVGWRRQERGGQGESISDVGWRSN